MATPRNMAEYLAMQRAKGRPVITNLAGGSGRRTTSSVRDAIAADKKASQSDIRRSNIVRTGATPGEANRALNALANQTSNTGPRRLTAQEQANVTRIIEESGVTPDSNLGPDPSRGRQTTTTAPVTGGGSSGGSTGGGVTGGSSGGSGLDVSETADSLYIDPTPIYDPILDFIEEQRTQANERYAQNKADISNIFGTLTTMRQEDAERIRSQYEQSIASQQEALAARTAEARAAQGAAGEAAQAASAELGGGPESTVQPAARTAQAAEEGIARANAYQTVWEGVQNTMQQQAQTDLVNAIAGYGYQELASVRDLQRSLENTLNELSGQEVGVRTDMAEAVFGQKEKVAEANYNEIMAQKAAEEAQRLANIKGYWNAEEARIDAAAALAEQEANARTRVTNYPDDFTGAVQFLRNSGATPAQIGAWTASIDAVDYTSALNSQDAYTRWIQSQVGREVGTAERAAARQYFDGLRYDSNIADILGQYGVPTPE